MLRTTTTLTTLAAALLVAATVSTGALAAGGGVDPAGSTSALAHEAPSAPAPLEPQQTTESIDGPTPQATHLVPTAEATPASETERSAVSTAVTESTTTTTAARPQPTTPTAPLAAQPAPFGSASPAPSTPACATAITGTTPGAPSRTSPLGVAGTTSADLQLFAVTYNAIRVANCLAPVPFANIRYDSCMEDRLFWMAEDPSPDPMSAWGHIGSQRSDGLPSVGCDGNLAGGLSNDGAIVAQKWWDSTGHRTSLYKPTFAGSTARVCIMFAMTHGGVPDEPYSFTRSAARWVDC
ncbi:hypothetical protein [Microcella sp.]|uniref:hypothetical protein n=1 Tax=Microcella sp. TaxID=1913979 RepID=UPI00256ACF8E|nr:hypothetical protein [Microcella sp.]MBX9472639.1 hypothetical protein [Microcella sp.]